MFLFTQQNLCVIVLSYVIYQPFYIYSRIFPAAAFLHKKQYALMTKFVQSMLKISSLIVMFYYLISSTFCILQAYPSWQCCCSACFTSAWICIWGGISWECWWRACHYSASKVPCKYLDFFLFGWVHYFRFCLQHFEIIA